MQITVSQELLYLLNFLAKVDEGGPTLMKINNGVLYTEGCAGDFGCCSRSVDLSVIEEIAADILTKDPNALGKLTALEKSARRFLS